MRKKVVKKMGLRGWVYQRWKGIGYILLHVAAAFKEHSRCSK